MNHMLPHLVRSLSSPINRLLSIFIWLLLLCTLAWPLPVAAQEPSPTTTVVVIPTATDQPAGSYERPLIVIESYGVSSDVLLPGQEFTLYIRLYNAGQRFANNVVATFLPGDVIPRVTGGVVAAPGIPADNRFDIAQPMTVSRDAWGIGIATVDMSITYTAEDGTSYAEKFAITIPIVSPSGTVATATPTITPTGAASLRPQLVITNYNTSVTPLQPGLDFTLSLTIQNLGNDTARRVTMIVGGGSASSGGAEGTPEPGGLSGGSGEFTNFAPLGSSNVQTLGELAPGGSIDASQTLIVNTSTEPGAFPMKISFAFVNSKNQLYIDDQVITLLVYSLPVVDINFYRQPDPFFAGQAGLLPLQIVNLGRKTAVMGNMRVEGAGAQYLNNVSLVGALDAGNYFTMDAQVIPDQPGPLELQIFVDYTDDFNQPQSIARTLTIDVQEMFIPPEGEGGEGIPGGEGGIPIEQAPETFLQKVWRFVRGLLGLDSSQPSQEIPIDIPVEESPGLGGGGVSGPLKGP